MYDFGKSLKEIRLERNKSVLDVERETGISNVNINRWENGRVIPNIDFCVNLADYYGVTLDALTGRENYATGVVEVKTELSVMQTECLSVFDRLTVAEKNQAIGFMKYIILQRGARVRL